MPEISIIVPIYNVEKYLHRCVDSILAQTFTDFELILVDDGSPDNCGAICDEYAKKDNRIIVIHKENGGLSDARNAGLDIAKGNYIGFVDSDDWIHPQMYEMLYNSVTENNCQFSHCKFARPNDNAPDIDMNYDDIIYPKYINITCQIKHINEIWEEYNEYSHISLQWSNLYYAELFKNVRFPTGLIFEDSYIMPEILTQCTNIAILNYELYYYYNRSVSIMNKNKSAKLFNRIDVVYHYIDVFSKFQLPELAKRYSVIYFLRYLQFYYDTLTKPYLHKFFKKYKSTYRTKSKEILNHYNLCRLYKLIIKLSLIHPILAYPFYKIAIK